MDAAANSDYDCIGFPDTDFCHTGGLVKALLLLKSTPGINLLFRWAGTDILFPLINYPCTFQ